MTLVETYGPLNRFLQLLGTELDLARSKAEALRYVNDPYQCPGDLLPLLAAELGVTYEQQMGMTANRRLLAMLADCYEKKGSTLGIQALVEAVTGWDSTISTGPNLVNIYSATPRWYIPSTVSVTKDYIGTASWWSTVVPTSGEPYLVPYALYPLSWYTSGAAGVPAQLVKSAQLYTKAPVPADIYFTTASSTSWGGTSVTFSTATNPYTGESDPMNFGIPVTGLSTVSSSINVYVTGTTVMTATFSFSLQFFDQFGNSLGSSSVDGHTYAGGSGVPDVYEVQDVTVPTGAVMAAQVLVMSNPAGLTSGVGEGVIISAPVLNSGATVIPYQPPRQVQITAVADRVNMVPNPSFEGDSTTGWTGTNCTLATLAGTYYASSDNLATNNYCLEITVTDAGNASISTGLLPASDPAGYISASSYVQPVTTTREVTVSVSFYNSSETLLGTITGEAVEEVVSQWVRPYIATQQSTSATFASFTPDGSDNTPPAGAILGGSIDTQWASYQGEVSDYEVTVTWADCAAGEQHLLDAAMLEYADMPGTYFDGDYYDYLTIQYPDYQWATPSTKTGPSYYYRNFESKLARLDAILAGNTGPTVTASGTNSALTVPGTPQSPSATAAAGAVVLEWDVPETDGGSPLEGFNVYMGSSSGGESTTPVNPSPITGTSYVVTGLQATEYFFTIKSVTQAGLSTASTEVNATPTSGTYAGYAVGPGTLLTVWEVVGEYVNNDPSQGFTQFSGKLFLTTIPSGYIPVQSSYIEAGEVIYV